jgi:cytochrome c-type biogenesis protein CcmF
VAIPIGLILLALTGIGPLIAWRKASTRNLQRQFIVPTVVCLLTILVLGIIRFSDRWAGATLALGSFVVATVLQEFWRGVGARHRLHDESYVRAFVQLVGRNRRRYGGYVVHLAIVTYFVAFSGMAFKRETEASLKPGESATLKSPYGHTYTFTHLSVSQFEQSNRWVTAATVAVAIDGKPAGVMQSEKRQHVDSFGRPTFEPSTEAGIRSGLREDVYIVFAGSVEGTDQAVYRFTINPLVWWVWYGGFMLVIGGIIVMWPGGNLAEAGRRNTEAGYRTRLADLPAAGD